MFTFVEELDLFDNCFDALAPKDLTCEESVDCFDFKWSKTGVLELVLRTGFSLVSLPLSSEEESQIGCCSAKTSSDKVFKELSVGSFLPLIRIFLASVSGDGQHFWLSGTGVRYK